MQCLYLALAMFLLLNLGAGMWRVLRGPADIDPIQFFGMVRLVAQREFYGP